MITSKANSVKSFLQRNIGSCTEMVKEACYKSMIRPILEYVSTASVVGSPYTKKNILMIEAVQRRAGKICDKYFQTSSVTAYAIVRLGWPSLEQRREIAKTTMMYKILHNMVAVPFNKYRTPITTYTRGHSQ